MARALVRIAKVSVSNLVLDTFASVGGSINQVLTSIQQISDDDWYFVCLYNKMLHFAYFQLPYPKKETKQIYNKKNYFTSSRFLTYLNRICECSISGDDITLTYRKGTF